MSETDKVPKVKRIDIPNPAKIEIARITQNMNNYIAGVAIGLGIEGEWTFDMQEMQIVQIGGLG